MISLSSLLLVGVAAAQIAVPPLKARVTDLTGTLNAQQRSALEQTLAEFEHRKGAQVAVLMVPSTQPETVEQYAVRAQESWKLGRKGIDDGVLLVVAKNDRKLRIEVGYGLEGVLPDAIAKRIIEDDITPRFKQGDFYGGIRAGTDRIMRVIEGEKLPAPEDDRLRRWWLMVTVAGVLAVGLVAWLLVRLLPIWRSLLVPLLVGGVAGTGIRFGKNDLVLAVFGGLVVTVFTLFVAQVLRAVAAGTLKLRVGSPHGASWSDGGSGWSSGGSSSSSDSGFSGGGGSSGGGGASGSW